LNLDFETRSTVDLKLVGSYIYAQHPSTSVLCASYSLDGLTVKQWRAWEGEAMPDDLKAALASETIHAWNAAFERLILKFVLKMDIPAERFRCTMARARSMALPGKLEMCAKALRMPVQKSDNSVMLKWCKPLKNGGWADDPQEFHALCAYCDVDVHTEMGLGRTVRELSPDEQRDWVITEMINDKGLPVDLDLIRAAQHYARDELTDICVRLDELTCGSITSPKQFQRIKDWFGPVLQENAHGKIKFDADARAELLERDDLNVIQREVVGLIDDGGRASTAKFRAMEMRAGPDGRVRGAYVFSGAGQTGRFSSTGAQLHNFVRAKLDNIEDVVEAILRRTPKSELIKLSGYNVLTTLSRTLRPSIVAEEGKQFVWGDWKAIEARVLPWLSKENSASAVLDTFARGEDIYVQQAAGMFGVAPEDVDKNLRQGGKVAVLAFGFGGGVGAFQVMAHNYDLHVSDSTADEYKRRWRNANPWAPRFWRALEDAAFSAVRNPECVFTAGRVRYMFASSVLWCMLPSGRMLAYPFAKIETVSSRFGPQQAITAIKGAWHPKHGSNYWPRMKLYGGIQAENCLGPNTEVLTDSGWKHIVDVSIADRVHDGVEFVRHDGLTYQGVQPVMSFGGVLLTEDHKVLVSGVWKAAKDTHHGLATQGFARAEVWTADDLAQRRQQRSKNAVVGAMRLRQDDQTYRRGDYERTRPQLRVSTPRKGGAAFDDTWNVSAPGFCRMAVYAGSVPSAIASGVGQLWQARHRSVQALAQVPKFLGRHGADLRARPYLGSIEQQQRIYPEELRMAHVVTAIAQPSQQPRDRYAQRQDASVRGVRTNRDWRDHAGVSSGASVASGRSIPSGRSGQRLSPVYDLLNAGPRHRFVVRGQDGMPFIVSNCTQGEAASLLRWTLRRLCDLDWNDCLIGHTHDEAIMEVPDDEVADARQVLQSVMTTGPDWAAGLPLGADIGNDVVYGK